MTVIQQVWNMEFWEQYLKKFSGEGIQYWELHLSLVYIISIAWNICIFILQNRKIMGLIYKRVGCKVLLLFWFLCLDVNNNVNKGFYLKSELGDVVF